MIDLYGIPNCGSVKRASDFLKNIETEFTFHNFKNENISIEKLNFWLKNIPFEVLVNKKGTTYRAMSDESKAKLENTETAPNEILKNLSVLKRPIIEKNGNVLVVGFDEEKYKALNFQH